ncbi:kinesin light chain 2 [Electrophorus electricus]|uniref:kinesin light chain 2 n=1 Tax=Electrophorus electricus TaxID=8005 RepID=UPI0015D0167F|nr:kinesin light chain 2 [Electrophorus electricus]
MSTMVSPCEEKLVRLTQEEIIASTKVSIQELEELKNDHSSMLGSLTATLKYLNRSEEAGLVQEKCSLLHKAVETIQLGLGEAQVMLALAGHLNTVESEKQKLRAQVRRLHQENEWLRDELSITQQKLWTSQQSVVQLEEEKKHLEFMDQLRKDDQDALMKEEKNGETLPSSDEVYETSHKHSKVVLPTAQQTALYKLAIQKAEQGHYETAGLLSKLVMEDVEKTLGHDHPVIATMLNILALGHRRQNNYKEATRLLREALAIREKCLQKEQPLVAFMLNNLSVLYGKTGNYAEAEVVCKRALELKEKVLGRNHPDVAKQLNNLALVYQNQGKREEVEICFYKALDIYQTQLASDDPTIPKTKNHLAHFYLKQGKYKEAEIMFKDILTQAHEKEFGTAYDENKPIWMHAEEMELNKDSVEKDSPGEYKVWSLGNTVNSPIINNALCGLGALYRQQGRTVAADMLEECATRTHKQGAAVVPMRDVAQKRSVKCDPGDEGSLEWSVGGPLRTRGSLGRMREVLRRSSEILVKKLQETILQDAHNPNMKRALSLNYLNRSGNDDESMQSMGTGRRLRDTRSLSSSTSELGTSTNL